jgi:hypothetical protein
MSENKGLQKYRSWTPEKIKQSREESDAEGGGMFAKLRVGKNHLRFLPASPTMDEPLYKVYEHRIPTDGGKALTFACPRMMRKEACKACTVAEGLKRSNNKADRDYGYQIHAKRRVYANVIDRKSPDRGVQVLAFGKSIHDSLLQLADPDVGGDDFTDPEAGFDIYIERKGTGKNDTEYTVTGSRKSSPLGNDEWLDQLNDLSRFGDVTKPTHEIEEALEARVEDDEQTPMRQSKSFARQPERRPSRTAEDDAVDGEFEDA